LGPPQAHRAVAVCFVSPNSVRYLGVERLTDPLDPGAVVEQFDHHSEAFAQNSRTAVPVNPVRMGVMEMDRPELCTAGAVV
jgi:hypothetical protein